MNAQKWISAIIYIGLIGSVGIFVITHAPQFKVAFGAVSGFFLQEMSSLQGNSAVMAM